MLKGHAGQQGRILVGLVYAYAGLVVFLTGVHGGFMDVGTIAGHQIASRQSGPLLVGVGFFLGLVVVIAEPAVHALTDQIQEVTSGYVQRRTVLGALSLGIGLAIALSMLRIMIPWLQLWHFLLPGMRSPLLMQACPICSWVSLLTPAAASGPMTANFIWLLLGGGSGVDGRCLVDGFGIIAMVAMTPLITLQILGLVYKVKTRKGGGLDDGADQ